MTSTGVRPPKSTPIRPNALGMHLLYRLHSACKAAARIVEVPCTGGGHASVDLGDFAPSLLLYERPPFDLHHSPRHSAHALRNISGPQKQCDSSARWAGRPSQAEAGHQWMSLTCPYPIRIKGREVLCPGNQRQIQNPHPLQ